MRNLMLLSLCFALLFLRDAYANGRLFVFGDSLSDNGNSFAITKPLSSATPAPPPLPPPPYGVTFNETGSATGYFQGRFTDGQNWVDYFHGVAQFSGVDIAAPTAAYDPNSTNGTNFAVGGSTSGNVNVLSKDLPSFPAQISKYVAGFRGKSAADDLCVIWIGANDFSAGIDPAQTGTNIKDGITKLSQAGARTFAVINIPDLALTPHVKALNGATILAARQFVFTTNVLLEVELLRVAFLRRINIQLVDINTTFVPLVYQPSRFGFTNSVTPALAALAANPHTNPNDYVFWDDFHPTTNAHYFAAEFIFKAVFLRPHFHEFLSLR
jgi:outer membrane lipase/esterase